MMESELRTFINHELPQEIASCIEGVFEINTDPEVSFYLLRQCITQLKKRHKNLYMRYMESDVLDE